MNLFHLIVRSLRFFWKSHFAVALGIAICTMVITGTLIVGDSIQSSLEEVVEVRLGKTDMLFSGNDRYFRAGLAREIGRELQAVAVPVLLLNGIATSQGGKFKMNNVQVNGIDNQFSKLCTGANPLPMPAKGDAYISANLADRLQINEGDPLVLRVEKASQIPKNAPFVTDEDNQISIRVKVTRILGATELGRFNLKASQTAPYNVFISLVDLNERMELVDKANKILLHSFKEKDRERILNAIQKHWSVEDLALDVNRDSVNSYLEMTSERVFIDSSTVAGVKKVSANASEILTYMINSMQAKDRATPYSFASAGAFLPEKAKSDKSILINRWLADDLNAVEGDSIRLSYFIIGPLRQLEESSDWFVVDGIVEMEGIFGDPSLMPDLPGMSDAGNCRDWEAGVPIQLDKIRDKDEDYWNKYRGTPKAFISYQVGKQLWENRFGVCTSIRIPSSSIGQESLENQLAAIITPESQGFTLKSVKEDGLTAARGGVDFGQLFMALSFFLLVSGMILMALLLNLHLERRISELGTFKALGYPHHVIKRIMLSEGLLVAIPGVLIGSFLAIAYNKLIFYALNTVWFDIVRTSILKEVILAKTLAIGLLISLILSTIIIWFNTNKRLRSSAAQLQKQTGDSKAGQHTLWLKVGGYLSGSVAFLLVVYESIRGESLNTGIFFAAGGLLLLSFILLIMMRIRKEQRRYREIVTQLSLIRKNISYNTSRSFRIVILFALGTFIVISTGLNKKDLHREGNEPSSGTGGSLFFMETTIPILNDLNNPQNQIDQGLENRLEFVQMRLSDGDDASCLNLNRVSSPRILGVPTDQLDGRFSFVKLSDEVDPEMPWQSLKTELPGEVVPAVLDQTVIQWGLGKKVGDTLIYRNEAGNEMKLKIVGGLANSVFQGNVLIDNQLFLKHYPSNSGSRVFLVDGSFEEEGAISEDIVRAFRNEGPEIQQSADRLAMFNQVENTYLSIFLLLGGLAMILGTVGLGVSLARNMLDRAKEIGILRAIGYQKSEVLRLISYEHMTLLLLGTLAGAVAAFIATMPSILSDFVEASWETAAIIVVLIFLNGWVWIYCIIRNFLGKDVLANLREE